LFRLLLCLLNERLH